MTPISQLIPRFVSTALALVTLLANLSLWAESAESAQQLSGDSVASEAAAVVQERSPEAWPRVLESGNYLLKLHPPQVESWDGRQLRARSAVEISESGKEGSTYGVVSYVTRTRVDKEARLVVFDEYQGITAKVPARPEIESKLLGFLQKELNDLMRVVALDRVETALAATRAQQSPEDQVVVRNDPPKIVFAERPTLLIYVDGLAFHSDPRQRVHDNRITNRLQMMGYRVLRFLGTETHNTPGNCVVQIKEARSI